MCVCVCVWLPSRVPSLINHSKHFSMPSVAHSSSTFLTYVRMSSRKTANHPWFHDLILVRTQNKNIVFTRFLVFSYSYWYYLIFGVLIRCYVDILTVARAPVFSKWLGLRHRNSYEIHSTKLTFIRWTKILVQKPHLIVVPTIAPSDIHAKDYSIRALYAQHNNF